MSATHIFKRLFQDNTGKYVVAQPPNAAVYIIIVTYLLARVITHPMAIALLDAIHTGAIFMWAYLEIVYGESPFRRWLGVLVMLLFLTSKAIGR